MRRTATDTPPMLDIRMLEVDGQRLRVAEGGVRTSPRPPIASSSEAIRRDTVE